MPSLLISIKGTHFMLLSGTLPNLLDSFNFNKYYIAQKTVSFKDDIILSRER